MQAPTAPGMRIRNLAKFAVIVVFLFIGFTVVRFIRVETAVREREARDVVTYPQKLEIVFNDFHATYGAWPTSPGPLPKLADPSEVFWGELMGVREAVINKRQIDFFQKNHVYLPTTDEEAGLNFEIKTQDGEQVAVIHRLNSTE